jgi:beta-aspartyl-peptidase (threonine type)
VVHGELAALRGEGGVVAVDRNGRIEMDFNSEGMFRACRQAGGAPEIHIYRAD